MSFTALVPLSDLTCGKCGGTYALAERVISLKREQGGGWHCPYCQESWGYWDSENDKLKKQLVDAHAAKARLQTLNDQLEAEKIGLEKKSLRISRGVCPCCNRTFLNLQRHMATKHPEKIK